MASIDDLEDELKAEPDKVDTELVGKRNAFIDRWGMHYNRKDMLKALDELLDFVKKHR